MKFFAYSIFLMASISFASESVITRISLDRYPFLMSNVKPESYKRSDWRAVYYTTVHRWAATTEKESQSVRNAFKKSILSNDSIIDFINPMPSWYIQAIAKRNASIVEAPRGCDYKKEVIGEKCPLRVKAKLLKAGSDKYFKHDRYNREQKHLRNSTEHLHASGSRFYFDPNDFDSVENHIIKVDELSKLDANIKFDEIAEYNLDKSGYESFSWKEVEVEFLKSNTGSYRYELVCKKPISSEAVNKCSNELSNFFDKNNADEKGFVSDYMQKIKDVSFACNSYCKLYPIVQIIKKSVNMNSTPQKTNWSLNVPTRVFTKNRVKISSPEVFYKSLFGINDEFSHISDLLHSYKDFQIMVGKDNKRIIPMINYPDRVYGIYQYMEPKNKAFNEGSRSVVNFFSSCMLRNLQKSHLSNILDGTYSEKGSENKTSDLLRACLEITNPSDKRLSKDEMIKILSKPNHRCSKYITTSGYEFQMGDASGLVTNKNGSLKGHQTHVGGNCIDVRPMRKTFGVNSSKKVSQKDFVNVVRGQYESMEIKEMEEELNQALGVTYFDYLAAVELVTMDKGELNFNDTAYILKGKMLVKSLSEDVLAKLKVLLSIKENPISNQFTKELFEKKMQGASFEEISALSESDLNFKFTRMSKIDGYESPAAITNFSKLRSPVKAMLLTSFLKMSYDNFIEKNKINSAVKAYFRSSMYSLRGGLRNKNEFATSEFIKTLGNSGAKSIAYIYGTTSKGHKYTMRKYGYEKAIGLAGHIDHIHFCFDYKKAEAELKNKSEAEIEKTKYLGLYQSCLNPKI